MAYQIWHDQITGTRYHCSEAWLQHVRAHLVVQLRAKLTGVENVQLAATRVARFWRSDYYAQLFPLRFGRVQDTAGLFHSTPLFVAQPDIDLRQPQAMRQLFLDGGAWPPILPDATMGEVGWLLADRLLIETALLMAMLAGQPTHDTDLLAAIRLAALTYPFQAELKDMPLLQGAVAEASRFLQAPQREWTSAPGLAPILRAVRTHDTSVLEHYKVGVGLVAAQRIKQYVFETPGLNEIRGASDLLNQITADLEHEVENYYGPEAVLRAAGSTLLFLAPANTALEAWPIRLRTHFFERTGIAFPAAATATVSAAQLLHNFGATLGQIFRNMGKDRSQADLPQVVTYPFEARCTLCQTRPAEQWESGPDEEDRLLCSVCAAKGKMGRRERGGKVYDILVDLGLLTYQDQVHRIPTLGVKGNSQRDWIANDLESLSFQGARRKLVGVIYGDGNNFGAVSLNLSDMALSFQWTARVEQTTRAAAALALGRATQLAAQQQGWQPGGPPLLEKLPFQVLALGGDDLSLFAWGPVAMHFAAEFTRLTDLELASTSQERLRPEAELNFSLGVLLTDEKTPVRKSVAFAEDELLKWAKKATKAKQGKGGTITMLYAEKADKVPALLETYREEMYLLGLGEHFRLCTTVRPYSAAELTALLTVASEILREGHMGRLQRLVSAFYGARQGAFAGMLHYAYQKGRFKDGGWIAAVEQALAKAMTEQVNTPVFPLLIDYQPAFAPIKTERKPFGLEPPPAEDGKRPPTIRFSPLWDLVELAKVMS